LGIAVRRGPSACASTCRRIIDAFATRSDFWLAYEKAFPKRTHRFCGKEEGQTNHAERWFGTLRARMSRLVRRSYSFSKSVERPLDAIHLFIASYNLGIKQATMD
jgi:IS1 family transposase